MPGIRRHFTIRRGWLVRMYGDDDTDMMLTRFTTAIDQETERSTQYTKRRRISRAARFMCRYNAAGR